MSGKKLSVIGFVFFVFFIYTFSSQIFIEGMRLLARFGNNDANQIVAEYHNLQSYHHTTEAAKYYAKALKGYLNEVRMSEGAAKANIEYLLGTHYECGKGTKVNLEEAKKWYQLSSQHGHPTGDLALNLIREAIQKQLEHDKKQTKN